MKKTSVKELTEGLPKKVNVLGTEYSIEYITAPTDCDPLGRQSLLGSQDYWTGRIKIYVGDERPKSGTWKVLLHEIIHAIVEEYSIDEIRGMPEHQMERVVDTLATGLYDTLVRNKLVNFS